MNKTDIQAIVDASPVDEKQLAELLRFGVNGGLGLLTEMAYDLKSRLLGRVVYFRGIIELSNQCRKNCYYCGIRRDNAEAERYMLTEEEILEGARFSYESGYGSIVLQSGERTDPEFVDFVEHILTTIKSSDFGDLGITLSLGEQRAETYRRWYDAGANRYLLRIETSNPEIYGRLHPSNHRFEDRLACLDALREIGYQVGTGVMFNLPGQSFEDLARDILFFQQRDVDMIGMGPYIPHTDTPLGKDSTPPDEAERKRLIELSLTMIAAVRLVLKDVNIASTTALQALEPTGREKGILAGANVIMPNVTPTRYRSSYQLYDGKPCLDENASMCRSCLDNRIAMIGETVGYHTRGDALHFSRRAGTSGE